MSQQLHVLPLALELIDAIAPLTQPIALRDRALVDQLRRAAQSIALNLAESTGHRGGNRRMRFASALGSVYETRAVLQIAASWGYVDAAEVERALTLADRVAAMTWRLLNPSR